MSIVVDASIVVSLIAEESVSAAARASVARESLIAPELVLGETADVLWRKVRLRMMTAEQARRAGAGLRMLFTELAPLAGLTLAALDLALRRDHPVYDCLYVALAQREGVPLLTADRRLAERFGDDVGIRLLG